MPSRAGVIDRNHAATSLELSIRFTLWAMELRGVPAPERIQLRFSVSRATAYRWRKAWCGVHGISTRPEAKPPKEPRNRVLKRDMRHQRAVMPSRRCVGCEYFRPGLHAWGGCKAHEFPTTASHTCLAFKKR
jgi:hypothetical protein